MIEKKQVLYDLKASYSGPFRVEEFYAEIAKWVGEKGYEIEPKRKSEHATKNEKKIEWFIEAHKPFDDMRSGVIVFKALMDNVKEITIKKNGKKTAANTGEVAVSINWFVQSNISGSFYEVKPVYYLLKTLIAKYVYNFWAVKAEAQTTSDCHDLFKTIRAFFSTQKYKYEL